MQVDKIWVVRGCDLEGYTYNVGYFRSEDKAFAKRDECKKESEEDSGDYFTVTGPYIIE